MWHFQRSAAISDDFLQAGDSYSAGPVSSTRLLPPPDMQVWSIIIITVAVYDGINFNRYQIVLMKLTKNWRQCYCGLNMIIIRIFRRRRERWATCWPTSTPFLLKVRETFDDNYNYNKLILVRLHITNQITGNGQLKISSDSSSLLLDPEQN